MNVLEDEGLNSGTVVEIQQILSYKSYTRSLTSWHFQLRDGQETYTGSYQAKLSKNNDWLSVFTLYTCEHLI